MSKHLDIVWDIKDRRISGEVGRDMSALPLLNDNKKNYFALFLLYARINSVRKTNDAWGRLDYRRLFMKKCIMRLGMIVGGALFGSASVAILKTEDAKKAYTVCTAAVLRGEDSIMKTVSNLRENCGDIYEDAKDINEKRYAAAEKRALEEAKALIAEHEAQETEKKSK